MGVTDREVWPVTKSAQVWISLSQNLNVMIHLFQLKDKYRTSVDVNKYRGLPPEYYKKLKKLSR